MASDAYHAHEKACPTCADPLAGLCDAGRALIDAPEPAAPMPTYDPESDDDEADGGCRGHAGKTSQVTVGRGGSWGSVEVQIEVFVRDDATPADRANIRAEIVAALAAAARALDIPVVPLTGRPAGEQPDAPQGPPEAP